MLRSLNEITGKAIHATDGDIGSVSDFYFDDSTWTIRYLVADTGTWLFGRQVLISPSAFQSIDWKESKFAVNLTKQQVSTSPAVDTQSPISRQQEEDLASHYNWPVYWGGGYAGVYGSYPNVAGMVPVPMRIDADGPAPAVNEPAIDPSLRSTHEVVGYHIGATDGDVGHVEDFIFDETTWTLKFLVVATRNWLPGKKVLIAPEWISNVDWMAQKVKVKVSAEAIKDSPEYDHSKPLTPVYEESLRGHYEPAGVKIKSGPTLL